MIGVFQRTIATVRSSSDSVDASNHLAPGMRLGRYELIRRLAVGGMAELYLARARGIEGFEKIVVLKRILPQFAQSSDFVGMFLDEARLSATLQHPNIAQVYDIGQWSGSYFFTMEYVRGEDLRAILKAIARSGRRLPLQHMLTIVAGAAAGLHAAHERRDDEGRSLGIVHRDVSPSNVLVSYDGAVKLVDFGVAKAAQRQSETRAGTLKGKIAYMSPEQCLCKPLDRRSDVFALGILLYELTTGRRLFKADSDFEAMNRIVAGDMVPPTAVLPKYPKRLEAIVLKALQREPSGRYATAQDLQLALEEFAGEHRLHLSTVKLGQFMRELFVEQMQVEEARAIGRARTEVLEGPPGVDTHSPPGRDTGSFELDTAGDDSGEVDIEIEEGSAAAAAGLQRGGDRVPRRRWPVLLGVLAAAAGVLLAIGQLGSQDHTSVPEATMQTPAATSGTEGFGAASEALDLSAADHGPAAGEAAIASEPGVAPTAATDAEAPIEGERPDPAVTATAAQERAAGDDDAKRERAARDDAATRERREESRRAPRSSDSREAERARRKPSRRGRDTSSSDPAPTTPPSSVDLDSPLPPPLRR